jgi:2-iminobutanoate/2-iminopropanoate deaminase
MQIVTTHEAPEPIGPYSQAIEVNALIYTSMQIPLDPNNLNQTFVSIKEEARQLFLNLFSVVIAGGGKIETIVKVNLYIKDLSDFEEVNEVYKKMFREHKPARSVINVMNVPKGFNLAVDCIAIKSE